MAEEISRKINVLEVNTTFQSYAGAQKTMVNFCKYYNKTFFSFFAVSYGEGGVLEDQLKLLGVPFLVANGSISAIIDFMQKHNIDIVHIHRSGKFNTFEFNLLKAIREKFSQAVIIETNVFAQVDKQSLSLIDCHLCKSKMMINERFVSAIGSFDFSKMKVLYNPVDIVQLEELVCLDHEVREHKKQLGIAEDDFVIGRLGRPDVSKWDDLLLDMVPYLIRLIPNIKFIIQAAPISRERKVKNSLLNQYIIFLPATNVVKNIALFYKTIDVYVHASKIGESFGMTLAEAGVFKKPTIVNSTPHKDNNQVELIDHMKTGIIANTPQTFARAVEFLYRNPQVCSEMGQKAYDKVLAAYHPERITRQLEKIFIDKIKEKGKYLDLSAQAFYDKIAYYPSRKEIEDFKLEYKKRRDDDFGNLTFGEKLENLLRKPKKIKQKIEDLLEHRYNINF